MTVKVFLDTNIVLYTIGQDEHKKAVARQLIAKPTKPHLSAEAVAMQQMMRGIHF